MTLISLAKSVAYSLLCMTVCTSLNAQTVSNPIGCAVPKRPVHIYYADPVKGSMNGDGSATRPWSTLEAVFEAGLINGQDTTSGVVHAGDLIYLMTGYHGKINIDPWHGSGKSLNTDFITIQAAPGNLPVLTGIFFQQASKWVFRGLTFQNPPEGPVNEFVYINHSDNILFDKNTCYSVPDATNWTPEDWATSCSGIGVYIDTSTSCTISRNRFSNLFNGAGVGGDGILFTQNTIDYFANDGIDFFASNSIISQNTITNHYGLWNNGSHHDGMQGWTYWDASSTSNVVIDRNLVIASTGDYAAIPIVPTDGADDYLQGISIFDGVWNNVTVTNNVVVARQAYHGLSLYGMTNATVENNTVIGQFTGGFNQTWLGVFVSQTGAPPVNVVVRNNIANAFALVSGVSFDHNLAFVDLGQNLGIPVVDPQSVFVNYSGSAAAPYNFHLCSGSPAIGTGTSVGAPTVDFSGKTRNSSSIDIGAYAY